MKDGQDGRDGQGRARTGTDGQGMVGEDVLRLALSQDDMRMNLRVPSVSGGMRLYTDGRVILAVPSEWPTEMEDGGCGEMLAKPLRSGEWDGGFARHEVAGVMCLTEQACGRCGGTGKRECSRCDGTGWCVCGCGDEHVCGACGGKKMVLCSECEGDGKGPDKYEPECVEIGGTGVWIGGHAAMLVAMLPDVEWQVRGPLKQVYFRFCGGQGRGTLMPFRKSM